ncbi:nitrite/sulfite reductase [Woodsholea maritima]|uniref:nitrite/sulfite reductase n=1 Tax=Woodsholea maritima TaxID=240237 RepID=UPI000366C279|nr:nitrite/sulfite reductase [Woodsholea maritima]
MYQYDEIDETLVRERVAEFRDQVKRRITGELSEDAFKPLRLQNGVYLQLHAYMLRVAIPYGTLSADQMQALGEIARDYDRGYGHFTTRQNIQYNWPRLVDIPDILDKLAGVGMHAIQTSGNCVRNTTTDPYAGAAADEVADPRPWCELIRQWSTFHPEFSFLPRKFKIAVVASKADRAAIQVHDIGLRLKTNAAGALGFEVFAGGGQGRTPRLAVKLNDYVIAEDLLAYITAILRVYNLAGRRDNKYKARIKILVEETGPEAFTAEVEAEFAKLQGGDLTLPAEEIARVSNFFTPPPVETRGFDLKAQSQAFQIWAERSVKAHKTEGWASVLISLKPVGKVPGDATAEQIFAMAEIARQYGLNELRVTKEQNIVLPHIPQADLPAVYEALRAANLHADNGGLVTDIISCPGLDYCNLANARSIPIAQAISNRLSETGLDREAGELTLNISGCINACGHHHIANIGLLGVDKRGEEFYQLTLGGAANENAAIGRIVGPGLSGEQVPQAIEDVVRTFIAHRQDGESFNTTLARIGLDPFKEAVYAH